MAWNCNNCKTNNYHQYDALGQHLRRKDSCSISSVQIVVSSLPPSDALVPISSDVMGKQIDRTCVIIEGEKRKTTAKRRERDTKHYKYINNYY